MSYGFIYKCGEDYALRMGEKLYYLSDGMSAIDEDVEIGGIEKNTLVDGYALRIDRKNKMWKIVDTGHKQCKDILKSGKYVDGFEKSIEPILKVFK